MIRAFKLAATIAVALVVAQAMHALWFWQGGMNMMALRDHESDPAITKLVGVEVVSRGYFSYHTSRYENGETIRSGVQTTALLATIGTSAVFVAASGTALFFLWRHPRP